MIPPSASLFLLILPIFASSMEVVEFVPDRQLTFALSNDGAIAKKQISEKGEVRLVCKGPGASLSWKYEEGLPPPAEAKEIVEGGERILSFSSFENKHDGLYSCTNNETNEKKRIRLFFWDNTVPEGFSQCTSEHASFCVHAKGCQVDEAQHVSCVCMKGWRGERCSDPDLDPLPVSTTKSGMAVIWIGFMLICLSAIVIAVKCHNVRAVQEEDKPMLVSTRAPEDVV